MESYIARLVAVGHGTRTTSRPTKPNTEKWWKPSRSRQAASHCTGLAPDGTVLTVAIRIHAIIEYRCDRARDSEHQQGSEDHDGLRVAGHFDFGQGTVPAGCGEGNPPPWLWFWPRLIRTAPCLVLLLCSRSNACAITCRIP